MDTKLLLVLALVPLPPRCMAAATAAAIHTALSSVLYQFELVLDKFHYTVTMALLEPHTLLEQLCELQRMELALGVLSLVVAQLQNNQTIIKATE